MSFIDFLLRALVLGVNYFTGRSILNVLLNVMTYFCFATR